MRSVFNIIIIAILFGSDAKFVSAGEWQTAGGQLCIDKCRYHNDNYHFYWCHVSDLSKSFTDGNGWGSWGYSDDSPETHLKWDYCVPSKLDELDDNGQEIFNEDDSNTIQPKGSVTTLYRSVNCYGKYFFLCTVFGHLVLYNLSNFIYNINDG